MQSSYYKIEAVADISNSCPDIQSLSFIVEVYLISRNLSLLEFPTGFILYEINIPTHAE
jgi:hypothetical protein